MYFTHPQFKKFTLKPFLGDFSKIDLKNKLNKLFPDYHIAFTDSGRSAFQLAIDSLDLENSEMLIPAYVCDIFKPIFEHYNIQPIYLDIDLETFHADFSSIESKITAKTKSILICHTYGLSVKMDEISKIAKKYNLRTIEDYAHIFPLKITGDCAFFSFAKLFPTINGGMLVSKSPIKTNLPKYKSKLSNSIKFLRLFPVLATLSEKFRLDELTLVNKAFPTPKKASKNSLKILNYYLNNFEEQFSQRSELAKYFQNKLSELGFEVGSGITFISVLVPKNINRDELFNELRKKDIFCSRIWQKPIYPNLPNTYEAAQRIINFPLQNWFTKKDIDKIIKVTGDILLNKN